MAITINTSITIAIDGTKLSLTKQQALELYDILKKELAVSDQDLKITYPPNTRNFLNDQYAATQR